MPKHFYITKTKCDENVENYRCVLFSSGDCQKHLSKFISLNYFSSKCSTWRELNSILTSCTSFDGWIWSMVNPIWEVVCWYCGTHLYSSIYSSKITMDGGWSHDIKRHLLLGRKAMTNIDSVLRKQRNHFADKGPYSQSYSFSNNHVQMWELDHKEGWVPKNRCFWIVMLEKTLESPLDSKEIKPVNPKEN